jgi:glucose-1-phosphate adenylyltransferase
MGKIVILAGGISSRMKNSFSDFVIDEKLIADADQKAKSMIRLGESGKPFLDYLLINIQKAGYSEVMIVINEKDNSITEYYAELKNHSCFEKLKISFAIQPIPKDRNKPLGTADALFHALNSKPDWKSNKFTMCNSDNLYSVNALKTLINSPYQNSLIDYNRDGLGFAKERIEKFAVTKKDEENYLTDIIEKPSVDLIEQLKSEDGFIGISMNIFRFSYDMIYPLLNETPLHHERNEMEIPTTVKMMIERYQKSVYAFRANEVVPDLSSKEDIPKVKEYLKNNFSNK